MADPGRAKMRALDVGPVMSTAQEFARIMAGDTARGTALADRLERFPTRLNRGRFNLVGNARTGVADPTGQNPSG
jgi:hypothetical protein